MCSERQISYTNGHPSKIEELEVSFTIVWCAIWVPIWPSNRRWSDIWKIYVEMEKRLFCSQIVVFPSCKCALGYSFQSDITSNHWYILPYSDAGLQYITSSSEWRDLFDWVIVSSRKPDFYRSERPFRRTSEPTWNAVTEFEPGKVYEGGNLKDFSRFTGFSG